MCQIFSHKAYNTIIGVIVAVSINSSGSSLPQGETEQQSRLNVLLGTERFPRKLGRFGIPWDPTENEMISSCKILLTGDNGTEAFRAFVQDVLHQKLSPHPTLTDTYVIRFFLGTHEVPVSVSIFQRLLVDDIDYKRKMYEHSDVIALSYSTASKPSFSSLMVKWYPHTSQFCPEAPLFMLGIRRDKSEKVVISEEQLNEVAHSVSAAEWYQINIEDTESLEQAFDQLIRYAVFEKSKTHVVKDIKKRRITQFKKKFSSSAGSPTVEIPGLPLSFLKEGTPEELADIVTNKTNNIRAIEGSSDNPILVSIQLGNISLARKLLELDNGVANFSDCNLQSVPIGLMILVEEGVVKDLNLSQNMLQSIPVQLRVVRKVNVFQNPLQTIPADIRKAKWSKIKKYLEQIAIRAEKWNIRKLLLVGEEAVGKSTLVRCLEAKGGKADTSINLATDGIDIKSIEMRGEQEPIVFSTWDMGGQLVFYPTHQFFLSNSAIYVVVFNMEDIQYPRIEYWMKQIKIIGAECSSNIIMVGTHCENCNEEVIANTTQKLIQKFPKHSYPGFHGMVFPVSARTGQGIRELKRNLLQLAHSSHISPVVPVEWVRLHEMLTLHRKNGTNFVNWNTYSSWGSQCGILPDNLEMATTHLHNSGSMIYYPAKELKDLVVLNPQWLADVMSCLITIKNNFVVKGYIQAKHLPDIFRKYPEKIHDTLIQLLQQFKIIYPVSENKESYLVPSLLPQARPSEEIMKVFPTKIPDELVCVGRIFKFGQLPLGLFSRLIVSILNNTDAEGLLYWRQGIVTKTQLSEESSLISLIEYERDLFRLSIHVRFHPFHRKKAVKLWREMLETIKTLIECFYPQLIAGMDELVPCVHCLRKQTYREQVFMFPYAECEWALREGDGFLYCSNIQSPSRCVFIYQTAPDIYLEDLPRLDDSCLEIEKVLGEGGFGTVYKAKLNGETVAVKSLTTSKELGNYGDKFQEFQSEAFMMSLLDHPNIVKFYGVMTNPPRMVIQYIDGTDLFTIMHPSNSERDIGFISQSDFPWTRRVTIAFHIANGLNYLQSVNPPIIHRDLRSPNIFVTKDDVALIGDFGLARVDKKNIGGTLRTWQWLAPEVFSNSSECYDQRSDIYSFGMILWELAAIALPFEEELKTIPKGKLQPKIIEEDLRPIIPDTTPPPFAELIKDCWKKNPDLRPKTSNILERLVVIMKNHNITPPPIDIEKEKQLNITFPTVPTPSSDMFDKTNEVTTPLGRIEFDDTEKVSAGLHVAGNIWVGYKSGLIRLYAFNMDTREIKTVIELTEHKGRISQFIEVNQFVLSSSEDGSVIVWDNKKFTRVYQWKPFDNNSISAYMKFVVSSSHAGLGIPVQHIWIISPFEGKITIWDLNFKLVHVITQETLLWTCTLEQHGDMILTGADNSRSISIYHVSTFDFIGSFEAHSSPVTKILSIGESIWTLSLTNLRVWKATSMFDIQCIRTIDSFLSPPRSILVTNTGTHVLTASVDGSILLWDVSTISILQELLFKTTDKDARVVSLEEDISKRLWCVSANQISVYPKTDDLHAKIKPRASGMIPRLSNIAVGRSSTNPNLLPQKSPGKVPPARPPPRPSRNTQKIQPITPPRPPPRAITASNDTPKRNRLTFVNPPFRANNQIAIRKLKAEEEREETKKKRLSASNEALLSPRYDGQTPTPLFPEDDDSNLTESSDSMKLSKSHEGKKRKKNIKVLYEDNVMKRVSKNISLSKLLANIPDFDLDSMEEGKSIQINCKKINGNIEIQISHT